MRQQESQSMKEKEKAHKLLAAKKRDKAREILAQERALGPKANLSVQEEWMQNRIPPELIIGTMCSELVRERKSQNKRAEQ